MLKQKRRSGLQPPGCRRLCRPAPFVFRPDVAGQRTRRPPLRVLRAGTLPLKRERLRVDGRMPITLPSGEVLHPGSGAPQSSAHAARSVASRHQLTTCALRPNHAHGAAAYYRKRFESSVMGNHMVSGRARGQRGSPACALPLHDDRFAAQPALRTVLTLAPPFRDLHR